MYSLVCKSFLKFVRLVFTFVLKGELIMFRRVVSYLLVIALVLAVGNVLFASVVNAVDTGKVENKVFDTATSEDDFVDNHVVVILNNAASLKFRSYSSSDFPEIACKSVQNLSTAAAVKVQAKLRGERLAESDISAALMNKNVKTETFKTILCLELETPGKENVLQAVKALQQREDVYYVGPDYIISLNLPRGTVASGRSSNVGWHMDAIDLNDAWQIETGSNTVKVGVLDTGIDANHPDLQGKVDTSLSRNFAPDGVSATTDPFGHGTHVAGIIGGSGNNSLGIRGVCQNITLVSLRVMYPNPGGPTIENPNLEYTTPLIVANAINYAEANNIPILNLSINAGNQYPQEQFVLRTALENYSGLAICSSGNKGFNTDLTEGSNPATAEGYDNIISVGASTPQNTRADFSNYGKVTVDLFAPGDTIASCYSTTVCMSSGCTESGHLSHGYHVRSGTSMATPLVTGVVALVVSSHPNLSANEIISLILDNTTPYAALTNYCVTGGILNAYDTLNDPAIHNMNRYRYINASRHKVSCASSACNYYYWEPHAYDGTGTCMICQ